MDLNFEQLLAAHNSEFKEAEVFSNWMPDDGEYIASIVKFDKGISSKDGDNLGWWKLTGRIEDVQDEKLNGREFPVGYYTSKAYGILKGAARILSGNSELNDLGEAHAVLEASPGLVLRVKVRTSISKKNGKEYTNCFILEVINTTTETVTDPEGQDVVTEVDVAAQAPVEVVDATIPAEAPAEVPAEAPPTV